MTKNNITEKEINKVYDHYYFNISKKLQICVGLWPYQSGIKKIIRRYIVYANILITMFPVVNGFRNWCGKDIDLCCETIVAIIYLSVLFLKIVVTSTCEYKLKKIFRQVAMNWLTINDPEEQAILKNYARQGRIKSVAYISYMVVGGVVFCQAPIVPAILDYLIPLNMSRQKILFVKGEYIVDPFKYYHLLYIYFIITTAITVTAATSIDSTYTMFTHQNLGVFSIVKHRLQLASKNYVKESGSDYNKIIEAVKLHKDALKLIELIETSYSFLFLIIINGTVMFLSTATVVAIGMNANYVFDAARVIIIEIGILIHLFYLSWPGQMLIDHTNDLFVATYTNEWYNISQRGKILLRILALKCIRPCAFTAGGLYVMNFQNFGTIIKTTISYITIAVRLRN